jgi:hypothetical protein
LEEASSKPAQKRDSLPGKMVIWGGAMTISEKMLAEPGFPTDGVPNCQKEGRLMKYAG